MAEYKTNEFGRNGTLIVDPFCVMTLEGDNYEYGSFDTAMTPEHVEWMVMSLRGVTLGEMPDYCKKHNPAIIITRRYDGKRFRYTHDNVLTPLTEAT
jgi:hypothetical protein